MTTSSSTVFRGSTRPGSRRRRGPSYGFLLLTLTLGSFSLTELSDDNPINMLDFVANIGGFWEILLLAWGVFFVATHETAPKQKARQFAISTKSGKHPVGVKGPRCPAVVGSERTCGVEDQLGSSQGTDTSNAGRQVGVAAPLDTWPSAGNRYGAGGSSVDNQLNVSQATDNTYGDNLGVVDNRLDISQPSHTCYNDDDVSVNESYV